VHAAADVAQQLGWLDSGRKFSIIGHSMGASVACALASSLQNVRKLIVIDGLGFTTRRDDSAAMHIKACIQQRIKIKAMSTAPRMYMSMVRACNPETRHPGNSMEIPLELLCISVGLTLTFPVPLC